MKVIFSLLLVSFIATQKESEAWLGLDSILDLPGGTAALCKAVGLGAGDYDKVHFNKIVFPVLTDYIANKVNNAKEDLDHMFKKIKSFHGEEDLETVALSVIYCMANLKEDLTEETVKGLKEKIGSRLQEMARKLDHVREASSKISDSDCKTHYNGVYKYLDKLVCDTDLQMKQFLSVAEKTKDHGLLRANVLTCPK